MEQIFFLTAGTLFLAAALWFGSALFRVWRAPEIISKRWKQMTLGEIERYTLLWENFFKEELQLDLHKENLRTCIPDLLKFFPEGRYRLKGYLLCGNGQKRRPSKQLFCPGEYFYGFDIILFSSFIGETLRLSCGAQWISTPRGPLLKLPCSLPEENITISPVGKLLELNCISNRREKEHLASYLHELCALTDQAQKSQKIHF